MKKKILVGVLLGAMLVSVIGCKKQSDGGKKSSSEKEPIKTESNAEPTEVPYWSKDKETHTHTDVYYGYSMAMPVYTTYKDSGLTYVHQNLVYDGSGRNAPEKFVGLTSYNMYTNTDVDINKINSVYDIHDNYATKAFNSIFLAVHAGWGLEPKDIQVADKAEKINGFDMLKYEGTFEMPYGDTTQTVAVTGYYIYANELPIVVMGADCTDTVTNPEGVDLYPDGFSLLDSVREDVEAMVHTFSTENWTGMQVR